MCSIATKEPVRKRRSSRLSQSEDVSGNGTDTASVAEEATEDDDDDLQTITTPRKRTRTNSLRKSTRKIKSNGLTNGTIEELDENAELDQSTTHPVAESQTNGASVNGLNGFTYNSPKATDSTEIKSGENGSPVSTGITLPRTDCLTNLLVQALQAGDDVKLVQLFNHNQENVMENTLRNLSSDYVQPLFQALNKFLLKNSTNPFYISWMRKLFQCKVSTIVNVS